MDINDILKQAEGRRLEFKEKLPAKANISKTIIAFANDAGGVLFIGIKDKPRKVVGVPEDKLMELEEVISNIIFDNCYPIISPDISVINIDGLLVLKVEVYKGSNLPYYLKNKGKNKGTYIRVGSSNREANEEIIMEMERLKRNISFDSEPVLDADYKELNIEKFSNTFFEETGEKLDLAELKKLKLITEYQANFYPTNALVLLSNDDFKNELFPYAKLECARFKGTTSDEFIDQKTINGNLIEQVEQAYEFVLRHINKNAYVQGVYTKKRWEYPVKAIREAIRNAVVHRDYSLSGKDVKIAIFDDMIEITNPGKLLPSIDYDKMFARQSDVRNKVIAPVFKHLGIIDQWGNGLQLIGDELNEYPNISLRWKEVGIQFQVQFVNSNFIDVSNINMVSEPLVDIEKSSQKGSQKSSQKGSQKTRDKIIDLMAKNKNITIAEIASYMNLSERTIKRYIKGLIDDNIIYRDGAKKSGIWVVKLRKI